MNPNEAAELKKRFGVIFFPKVQGNVVVMGASAQFEKFSQHRPGQFMPLGSYSYSRSFFTHALRIGRYCSIGANVEIMGESHPTDWISSSPIFYRPRRASTWKSKRKQFPPFNSIGAPVEIEHDVWIGDDALIAPGVKLGTGCVIAARAIVTKDVPPYAIVGGSPAKLVRWRFNETLIEKLLSSQWWEWPIATWDDCDPQDVGSFLDAAAGASQNVPRMPETRMTIQHLLQNIRSGDGDH